MTIKLTEKERLVLACYIEGMTDKQIAEKTGISLPVIRSHIRQSLFKKAGASNRTQVAVWGWTHGITANGIQRNGQTVSF